MAKQVITGRVPPQVKEGIQFLNKHEGVPTGKLLEMALEMYIPEGKSAREWQIESLERKLDKLKMEKIIDINRVQSKYNPKIEMTQNHLRVMKAIDKTREDKIKELLPRWVECHDLDHRRSDPYKIIRKRAHDHPFKIDPWFVPFGIEVSYSELMEIWHEEKGVPKCQG